jgi:hypothetical protein
MTSSRPLVIELRGVGVSLNVSGDKGWIMVAKLPRPLQASPGLRQPPRPVKGHVREGPWEEAVREAAQSPWLM